jgi:hypothetical protein
VRDELSVLSAFLAMAEERSFTRAAKRLNISTSTAAWITRSVSSDKGDQSLEIAVNGSLILDDTDLMIQAASAGPASRG